MSRTDREELMVSRQLYVAGSVLIPQVRVWGASPSLPVQISSAPSAVDSEKLPGCVGERLEIRLKARKKRPGQACFP